MSKKGFTLIELLAVLVILVIIMAIATPIILGIIDDARDSANLREIDFIIDGAETLFAMSDLDDTEVITDGKTNIYNQIQLDAGKPESGVVVMDSLGNVGVAFFLDNKCYKKETFEKEVYVDETSISIEDCVVPILPSELATLDIVKAAIDKVPDQHPTQIYNMVFESNKQLNATYVYENYTYAYDVSKNQDNSVIMFLDGNTLRFQAKGKILAPVNMSGIYESGRDFKSSPFGYFQYLKTADFRGLDTSQVTDMSYLFVHFAGSLTTLNISGFNTENVTNMSNMFALLRNVTAIDVSSFVTTNVTDMSSMFNDLRSVTELDLKNFETSNVVNMQNMFRCASGGATVIDVSSFNTKNVTDMKNMFSVPNVRELNLSNFDFTKAYNSMNSMLYASGAAGPNGKIYVNSHEMADILYHRAAFPGYELSSANFINPDTNEEYNPS